mmetsp:Transcript_24286/g.68243  ORF Transcript_24286/g.68243 Transcript_24286/m.68243 type:complete len:269 (-) Transcript_24286:1430-2236(-)
MNGEWKAPDTGCMIVFVPGRFSFLTAASNALRASRGPATTLPFGKSWFATLTLSGSNACKSASSYPTTVIIPDGDKSQAAPMASDRTFNNLTAVAMSMTPANVSAEYSPNEKPAVCVTFCRAVGSSWCSLATAAMLVRNTQTCEKRVSFRSVSGPFWISSSRSLPKTSDASENISRTPATSSYGASMPTFCAPWPGNNKTRPVSVHGGNFIEMIGFEPTSGRGSSPSAPLKNFAVHQPSTASQGPPLADLKTTWALTIFCSLTSSPAT